MGRDERRLLGDADFWNQIMARISEGKADIRAG